MFLKEILFIGKNNIATLIFFFVLIAVYGVFVFIYYHFLSQRDIFKINLSKYKGKTKYLKKFFAIVLFIIEYIILMPIFVLLWFAILSVFILVLSQNLELSQILLISAALVGAVRITAYIHEDLSKDLAKLFPFTLLGVFLLNPGFFNLDSLIIKIKEIPNLLSIIINYIALIFILETSLRILYTIISFPYKKQKIKELEKEVYELKKEVEKIKKNP